MKKFFQINLGRLHILLAKNDWIMTEIKNEKRRRVSFRFDRVPSQVFFTGRIMHVFLNIDWV